VNKTLEQAVKAAEAESRRLDIAAAVAAEIEDGKLQLAAEMFESRYFFDPARCDGPTLSNVCLTYRIDKPRFLSVLRGRQAIRRVEHEANRD